MAEEQKTPILYGCDLITFDDKKEPSYASIIKSDTSEQLDPEEAFSAYEWIPKRYAQQGLKMIVNNSTILPQCIEAYEIS